MRKLFLIATLLVLVTSCKTKEIIREVPVETIREVEKKVFVHDSIHEHDSVFMYIKGDTVVKERIKYVYVGKTVHDTLTTHDTIPQIINTETTKTIVEKKPQWWPVWLSFGLILSYLLITKTKFIEIIKNFIKYLIKLIK